MNIDDLIAELQRLREQVGPNGVTNVTGVALAKGYELTKGYEIVIGVTRDSI